jgi:hypothetical protein
MESLAQHETKTLNSGLDDPHETKVVQARAWVVQARERTN